MDLGIVLGELNFVNFLHVRFEKVSNPGITVWEDWIPVPFTQYNLIATLPDADNYYMLFYEAPDNVSLGTFKAKSYISALSAAYEFEIRFYKGGALPVGATLDVTQTILTDDYLIGKDIFFVDKEGHRIMNPLTEYTSTPVDGTITLLNDFTLQDDETMVVVIKNKTTTPGIASGSGLYTGYINITENTRTLLNTEKNKRCRLVGTMSTQIITLPLLSFLSNDDGYYFDNSVGGVAVQVKLLIPGSDKIRFNGFMAASNLFSEFWVSIGEHLLIRKFDNNYWEVLTDYKGVHVGERFASRYKNMPGTLPEDGSEVDGNEYGRLWWWINNILPNTHYIVDDTGTQISNRRAQFIIKPTTKKILMPNMQNMSERGLVDFNVYGVDIANRPYDYPGGIQAEMVGPHTHPFNPNDQAGGSDNNNNKPVMIPGSSSKTTGLNSGTEQRVINSGFIYLTRI